MPAIVRVNGRATELEDGVVGALDHGFLYGNGLFETMRATNGTPFRLHQHLERIREAGLRIGLPVPSEQLLRNEVAAALADAGEDDAYVRLTVSRGVGAPGPDPSSCGEPTIVVVVKPFPPAPGRWLTEGISAQTSTIRRNTSSPLTRVKSLNYMECILAKQAAKARGADEALFLDTEGNLAEATAWNLFFVEGERLCTPHEEAPILPGITRAVVLELAAGRGFSCEEGWYAPERLITADEAFLTNSLYGIVPLGSLDGERIGSHRPAPLTEALSAEYEALRRRECGG
jgi:aminodeoxychorismate lyase